jgi:hypothetical protein
MHYFNKMSIQKIQNQASKWIISNWFILHILYIIGYLSYVILKLYKVKVFSSNNVEYLSSFSLQWFLFNIIGFVLLVIAFISGIKFKFWQYVSLIVLGFIIITISYVKTLDPSLNWYGSDVARGNYVSAEETVKYGGCDIINKWNDRANPYDSSYINAEVKETSREFFAKYNLSGLILDKWKCNLDSNKYNFTENDRPYVHSPFTILIMGYWLKIFPYGKWSLEYQMLFLNIFSILFVIIFANIKSQGNFKNIVIISLVTSPVMYRFHSPSVDQLCMLLFTLPIFLFLLFPSKSFSASFLYGVIYGFCFYSKFTVLFFILLLFLSYLFYIKQLTIKPILGLITGLILPIILFTSLGYYFWLTLITGRIISQHYAINSNIGFWENVSKFLYFGPSFILLSLFVIINSNKLKRIYLVFMPTLISLLFLIIFLYDQNGWNRYLTQYMPVVLLFLLSMDNTIELRKKDLFVSLLANFIFLHLNIYF